MRKAIRNGIIINESEASLPLSLKSVQYSYSVYESVKLKNGQFVHLAEHLKRLRLSSIGVGMNLLYTDSEITSWLFELKAEESLFNETFRILVLGEDPAWVYITHRENFVYPESYYTEGVAVTTYRGERFLPQLKTSNLLLSYMALKDAEKKNAFEALLVDEKGFITEGTRSNFYAIKNNRVYTAADEKVLSGVTRTGVMKALSDMGIPLVFESVRLDDLSSYSSLFITATSMRAIPVKSVDGVKVRTEDIKTVQKLSELLGEWE